jgi:Histidine kinase-like ATPase domain
MAVTGDTPLQGTGPLARASAPVSGQWRRLFPGEARQLGVVRRWVESLLPGCPARDDVACVVTELGANAVMHTASGRGGWFAVEIAWYPPSAVRVAVTDDGAADGPRLVDDPAAEHGRGLRVVAALSVRTGACGDQRGRMVWADVPWGEAAGAELASPPAGFEAAISAGETELAGRFAGVPAWFGRFTLRWWALAGGELVTAASPGELAGLIARALDRLASWPSTARDAVSGDAEAGRGLTGAPVLRFPPGGNPALGGGRRGDGLDERTSSRLSRGTGRPGAWAGQDAPAARTCRLPLATAEPGGRSACSPPGPQGRVRRAVPVFRAWMAPPDSQDDAD